MSELSKVSACSPVPSLVAGFSCMLVTPLNLLALGSVWVKAAGPLLIQRLVYLWDTCSGKGTEGGCVLGLVIKDKYKENGGLRGCHPGCVPSANCGSSPDTVDFGSSVMRLIGSQNACTCYMLYTRFMCVCEGDLPLNQGVGESS